jgi:hypothetical protein
MNVQRASVQGSIRREATVSAVLNAAVSLAFFLLVLGLEGQVELWGVGNYASTSCTRPS